LARLDGAYAQLQGFNADVAHERCTPLATLIGTSEMALRKGRSNSELIDVVGSNLEELRRLAGIVQDMLFLSQADRGSQARRTITRSLATELLSVTEYHEAAIAAAGLTLSLDGDAAGAFDLPLLKRAVSNLLSNATRYAERGSRLVVSLAQPSATCQVHIAVTNSGPPIPPQELPRIFDRFYRVDKSRTEAAANHGLGLSIVAAIARMHGGSVFARSSDRETTVGMQLPVSAPGASASAKPI